MRTIPCFIQKNTPELVGKLKDLGLKVYLYCNPNYLLAHCGVVTGIWPETVLEDLKSNGVIDCGDNEDLFCAIAALRDDSDKNQWFVTEEEIHWPNQNAWMPVGSFIFSCLHNYTNDDGKVHKATIEELIEHFGSDINVGSK